MDNHLFTRRSSNEISQRVGFRGVVYARSAVAAAAAAAADAVAAALIIDE